MNGIYRLWALRMSSFTEHDDFKACPGCSVYRLLIFYYRVAFRWVAIPRFVYAFSCQWADIWVVPVWSYFHWCCLYKFSREHVFSSVGQIPRKCPTALHVTVLPAMCEGSSFLVYFALVAWAVFSDASWWLWSAVSLWMCFPWWRRVWSILSCANVHLNTVLEDLSLQIFAFFLSYLVESLQVWLKIETPCFACSVIEILFTNSEVFRIVLIPDTAMYPADIIWTYTFFCLCFFLFPSYVSPAT